MCPYTYMGLYVPVYRIICARIVDAHAHDSNAFTQVLFTYACMYEYPGLLYICMYVCIHMYMHTHPSAHTYTNTEETT